MIGTAPEQTALGLCLSMPEVFTPILEPVLGNGEDFSHTALSRVWRSIVSLGPGATMATVYSDLQANGRASAGGLDFLSRLIDAIGVLPQYSREQVEALGHSIRDAARIRRTKAAILEAAVSIKRDDDPEVVRRLLLGAISAEAESRDARQFDAGTVCAEDIEERRSSWLWKPYVPNGGLTMLSGDSTAGKTWLISAIAAAVTTDSPLLLPGFIAGGGPRNVLLMAAEDQIEEVLKPRLRGMGADLRRIHFFTASFVHPDGSRGYQAAEVSLASGRNLPALEEAIQRLRPALFAIDPLSAFIGDKVDTYRDNEVRGALRPLVRMASGHEFAILTVRHLSKGTGGKAQHAGIGSVAFSALARSELFAMKDPEDGTELRRLLVHNKANNAPLGASLVYEIHASEDELGIFRWNGRSSATRETLQASTTTKAERTKQSEAREMLRGSLPASVADMRKLAEKLDISWRTVERAKAELGALVTWEKDPKTQKIIGALWSLPSDTMTPNGGLADRAKGGISNYIYKRELEVQIPSAKRPGGVEILADRDGGQAPTPLGESRQ